MWIVLLGFFYQGSGNYNLDYEKSDVDTKLIVTPTFREIVFNKSPISTTHSSTTTTIKTEQFQRAPIGWICPKCGRGLAPHTSYCPCYMEKPSIPYRDSIFNSGDSPFDTSVAYMNAINHSEN